MKILFHILYLPFLLHYGHVVWGLSDKLDTESVQYLYLVQLYPLLHSDGVDHQQFMLTHFHFRLLVLLPGSGGGGGHYAISEGEDGGGDGEEG